MNPPRCECQHVDVEAEAELQPLWQAQWRGLIIKEQKLGKANPALYSKPDLIFGLFEAKTFVFSGLLSIMQSLII